MNLSKEEIKKEKEYLKETIDVIKEKISSIGQTLYEREDRINEFKKFIWDSKADMDDMEMKSMINASELEITLAERRAEYFHKLYNVQDSPYFGSITFTEDGEKPSKIYIGKTYVEKEDENEYLVYDWRSPISSMFYDYEIGRAKYKAPGGEITGEITNKRQFNIKDGKLVRVFDNNINIDDELLQEVLAEESSDKMKNIVNTIQEEQNSIIRNVEDKNLIVQGIAGSGKTSVALHRIAFLLYKIENLRSNNVLIFSPNSAFSAYISNVLPELGENNTMQTTFADFLLSNLEEFNDVETFSSFVNRYYKYVEKNKELVKYKQGDKVIVDIKKYVEELVKGVHFLDNIEVDKNIVEKDELNYLLKDRYEKLLLFERIDEIAENLCRKLFKGKMAKKKTIISMLKKNLSIKLDFKEIYKDFFSSKYFLESFKGSITDTEIKDSVKDKKINYEDACLFVFIKGLLEGFKYLGNIKEVVIDEAQDYNMLQYLIIRNIFKKSNFTILGDVNQTVNPYYKYDTLETLKNIFKSSRYIELNKTYRSTPEIIDYTNKILGLNHVSAIRRNLEKPVLFREEWNLKEQLLDDISNLKKQNYSIAIVTKTIEESDKIYELLKDDVDISRLSDNVRDFNKKMITLPSFMAKGLEFDSVIIYTDSTNKYTEQEKYLYYVSCTRAQHELIIYNQ